MNLAKFGSVVSIDPSQPNTLVLGEPDANHAPVGILLAEEAKMQQDPAMPEGFFEGEAATYIQFGQLQFSKWAAGVSGLKGPALMSKVLFNTTTGEIGFIDFNDTTVPSGFKLTTATVIKSDEPNGCTVFLGNPQLVASTGSDVTTTVATPTMSPAGGDDADSAVVADGVSLSTTTHGADIYYTLDGTEPSGSSDKYNPNSPIVIEGAVEIKAVAIKAGMTNSAIADAFYKIA
jgi:hypothetical protein